MDTRAPDRKKGFLSGAFFFLSLSNLLYKAAHGGGSFVPLLNDLFATPAVGKIASTLLLTSIHTAEGCGVVSSVFFVTQ